MKTIRPKPEPAHISLREWTLLILDEKARRHAAERPPEPEQGNGTKGSIDPLLRTPPEPEGACQRCGSTVLFLDESRPSPTLTCGGCLCTWPALAPETRRAPVPDGPIGPPRPSFLARVTLHLRALFSTANNREARP